MKKGFLLLLILPLSVCRVPNGNNETAQTILWKTDSEGFVQLSTNESQYLGNSFISIYGTFQDPMGTFSAEAKKISGNLMGAFGLVFCYQDIDNYYLLCIDVQGFYAIYRRAGGSWSTMANWAYCEALNKGYGVINTLGVTCNRQDSSFLVFVNDSPAATFRDTRFTGGYYGYSVDVLSGVYERFPECPVDVRFRLAAVSGITVSPVSGLVTTEGGGTDSFTVVLNSKPTANVTLGLWNSDPTEGTVNPSSLVFTPDDWAVAQTVTIAGVDDLVDDEDRLYTIVTLPAASTDTVYSGIDARDVQVSNTDDDPPPAPDNLVATAVSATQDDLMWDDNSTNEDGFKIERKVGVEGSYAQIGTVGASVTTYTHTVTRIPGDIYYYRVRTYNVVGDSDYSNEATSMRTLVAYDNPSVYLGGRVAISGEYAVSTGDGAVYVFRRTGANSWEGGVKLLSPEPESGSVFGSSVAIDGDYLVVGASGEDEGATDAGAAYVFRRTGVNTWDPGTKIVGPVTEASNRFGSTVRISGDYLIAAASGEAVIFHRTGENTWDGGFRILAPDAYGSGSFGCSVAIDGDYAVVGDQSDSQFNWSGAAFIFHRTDTNSWGEYTKVMAADGQVNDSFGKLSAINGDYAVIGATKIYVFHRTGTNSWDPGTRILSSRYGDSLANPVAIEGDHIVVGADRDTKGGIYAGAVFFFHRTDVNSWNSSSKFYFPMRPYGSLGYSVDIAGGRTMIGFGAYVLY